MNRIFSSVALSLLVFAAVFLTGCAGQKLLRDPSVAKCYVVDSTKHLSAEDHTRIFQGVESEGHEFLPCDSASPEGMRIRPQSSRVASKTLSYIILGSDAVILGAGFGLGLAYGETSWLMPILLQATPTSTIYYRADYTDSKGKARHQDFFVISDAWFKDREESRPLLIEQARRDLSSTLYGRQYPEKETAHFWRASLDLEPLMLSRENGGIFVEPRLERLFPGNFSLGLQPAAFIPFSTPDHRYTVQAGPRRYFGEAHSGFYMGFEPYAERAYYYGRLYSRIALPITFGLVFQRQNLVTSIDVGMGPTRVLNGAYRDKYVALSGLSIGYAF